MIEALLKEPQEIINSDALLVDCRFDLARPDAGRAAYLDGHIPGAVFLDLERDLSAPKALHGGRHPLPAAVQVATTLAGVGIHQQTQVIAYDDSAFCYAARLWWMMRALGYRPPALLNGGYSAWVAAGGKPETAIPDVVPCAVPDVAGYAGLLDIDALREAQAAGVTLVDSRDPQRYRGEVEPIDPVAGHIPGANNRFWRKVSDAEGRLLDNASLKTHWGDLLLADNLVVYCGSGVSACINLFTLASLGRPDARLYGGSWSDWCSYL